MPDVLSVPVEAVPDATVAHPIRRRRLFALAVVLCVSLLHFVVSSFYYLFGGTVPSDPQLQPFRLVGAIIAELTSLLLLWYVISERGGGWSAIGWNPRWSDLWRGFGLLLASLLATIPPVIFFQLVYRAYTGHYLEVKSLHALLGFTISAFSIAFVLVNPFFEELIVCAYTMSEVMDLSGSRMLAIVISVSLQMSYHFYQGVLRSIAVAAIFTVFSIYFARTRRIAPVILAHFCIDAFALIKGVA